MAGHPRYASLDDALWSRVEKAGPDDCWLWTAAVASHGYGNFNFRKKLWLAHVAAYVVSHKRRRPTLANGRAAYVLHRCDVPRCCNPAHLYCGTQKQNMRDRLERNPAGILRGEDAPRARLSAEDVQAIRAARKGWRYGDKLHLKLAAHHGVHIDTIISIWSGRTWRSLPCP